MEFGITLKNDLGMDRTIALCLQAEQAGFDYVWLCDSHIIWRECYTTMAVCLRETKRLRFGTCVTNPGVRDWTLAASTIATLIGLGGERVDIGVGRGDSSVRVLGRKQFTIKHMLEFIETQRALLRGEKIDFQGHSVQITWSAYSLPIWIAAYGPRALAAAGIHGDGLILQIGDPALCRWFIEQAKSAGAAAGKDMSGFRVQAAAAGWVGDDLAKARDQARWFPAMVANHVADILARHGTGLKNLPKRLTEYVEQRKSYDYLHHAEVHADHAGWVGDDVTDAFTLLGPPNAHVAKLKELEATGVTQFNLYLMCGEEERQLAEYGEHIIPKLR